jgi:DNA-binding CsgD family transcriptional regulator/GAF domain-containing protein
VSDVRLRRQRQQQRVIERCHVGSEAGDLFGSAVTTLCEAVPCAVACHGAVDPETWLPVTHADDDPTSASYLGAVWHNEYLTPDVNKLRLLGHAPRHVGTLSQATAGELWRSPRYQTIFRPIGIEHELRAALMADGSVWGYLVLLRTPEMPDFSADEAAFVAAIAPHLAEAQRTDQLAAALGGPRELRSPGLLLLDAQDEVLGTTREADELLEELGWGVREGRRLPEPLYLVATAARAAAQGTLEAGTVPRGRLRTPSGQWLLIHAAAVRASNGGAGQVAITLEPAQPSVMASLLVKAYEFTEREQQVVLHVLQGLPTDEIAWSLCVSSYTVQDHLKAIFDKASVRSRRDLVAEVFYRHHSASA